MVINQGLAALPVSVLCCYGALLSWSPWHAGVSRSVGNLGGPGAIHAVLGLASAEVSLPALYTPMSHYPKTTLVWLCMPVCL